MKKVFNYVMLALTVISGITVILPLIGQYEGVAELSRYVYGTDYPLMGSWFFHYLLQPATGYVCAVILLAILVKEFYINEIKTKLILNVLGFVLMEAFGALYIAAMNLPGVGW